MRCYFPVICFSAVVVNLFFTTIGKCQEVALKPSLGGVIEPWYINDYSELSKGAVKSTFKIRRARLIVNGNLTPKLSYRFQVAFEGSTVRLFEAFAEYKFKKWFALTAGQFKYSFTHEGLAGVIDMPFIIRAEPIQYIAAKLGKLGANFRDMGIEANGAFLKSGNIKYTLAIINGNGINIADNNNSKDIVGSLEYTSSAGISIGSSAYKGNAENKDAALKKNEKAMAGYLEYIPPFLNELKLRGEYVSADYTNIDSTGRSEKTAGWYALASYMADTSKIKLPLEAAIRYEQFKINSSFGKAEASAITFGLTYYLHKKSRLRANYIIRNVGDNLKGGTHIQETSASGKDIHDLFILQALISF